MSKLENQDNVILQNDEFYIAAKFQGDWFKTPCYLKFESPFILLLKITEEGLQK